MADLGLPVPPAFVITTRACAAYQEAGEFPPGLDSEIADGIAWLEQRTNRTYGGGSSPLLVSVRSGAPISMPGMMDTVLNTGITAETEAALAAEMGDADFAGETHRRFYELYSNIVLKSGGSVVFDPRGTLEQWNVAQKQATGQTIPADARSCLHNAIHAVFQSWDSRRARRYRQHHQIADDLGTAVTIQAMVFGNLSDRSGTGVMFSRNPISGERIPYGEFLPRAQGEDVVSGRFTPESLDSMRRALPGAHEQLLRAAETLEKANGDVQDIEFTVQDGELFILQTRAAKRAPAAAVRFAVDLSQEGLIDAATALERVTPDQLRSLLAPHLADNAAKDAATLAKGQSACPGVGIGTVITDTEEAEKAIAQDKSIVLARVTTSPEDLHGMIGATAIVTELGGSTSHAAVLSRSLGIPCVTGCGEGAVTQFEGREITVDAANGVIYDGQLGVIHPREEDDDYLKKLRAMAEAQAPLQVLRAGGDARTTIVDLNVIPGGEDPENLPRLLAGASVATGGALTTDAGMAAAIVAGVKTVIGNPTLPLLLSAARANKRA
jgi:pyruvate,orthophosphate dikinase